MIEATIGFGKLLLRLVMCGLLVVFQFRKCISTTFSTKECLRIGRQILEIAVPLPFLKLMYSLKLTKFISLLSLIVMPFKTRATA